MKFLRLMAAILALMLMTCCCVAEEAPAEQPAEQPAAAQEQIVYSSVLLSTIQSPYESWFGDGMPACFAVMLMMDMAYANAISINEITAAYAVAPEAYVCEYPDENNGKLIELYMFFCNEGDETGSVLQTCFDNEQYTFTGETYEYTGDTAEIMNALVEAGMYTAAHHVTSDEFAMTLAYMNQIFAGQTTAE